MKITRKEYYNQLNESLKIIDKWAKIGMIMGQTKEKYGSTRWYVYFGNLSVHKLFYPQYFYYQWPKWTSRLNNYSEDFFKLIGLNALFIKYQVWCYRKAYHEILVKYKVVDHCIDCDELLDKKILNEYYDFHNKNEIKFED